MAVQIYHIAMRTLEGVVKGDFELWLAILSIIVYCFIFSVLCVGRSF